MGKSFMNNGRLKPPVPVPSVPVIIIFSLFLLVACGPRYVVRERRTPPPEKGATIEKRESRGVQQGIASWYGADFHGKQTSSGEVYDMYQLTCAHNTLPLGTMVMGDQFGERNIRRMRSMTGGLCEGQDYRCFVCCCVDARHALTGNSRGQSGSDPVLLPRAGSALHARGGFFHPSKPMPRN